MYELRILSGLHNGATLPLDDQAHVIGASEEADVVLADGGIEQRHATLSLTESGWLLSVLDGGIRPAANNQPQTLMDLMPGDFARVGDVWITVAEQGSEWMNPPPEPTDVPLEAAPLAAAPVEAPPALQVANDAAPSERAAEPVRAENESAGRSKRRMAYLPFALAAVLTGAAAYGITYMPSSNAPTHKPETPAEAKAAKPAALTQAELQKAFRKRLADADLLKRFDLNLSERGWEMKGALDDEEAARFERILTVFVKAHGINFPVQVKIGSAEAMLPFKIRQVITGANASLVTQEGDRLFVGDEYRGVRLVAVAPNALTFGGKRKIEVRW